MRCCPELPEMYLCTVAAMRSSWNAGSGERAAGPVVGRRGRGVVRRAVRVGHSCVEAERAVVLGLAMRGVRGDGAR